MKKVFFVLSLTAFFASPAFCADEAENKRVLKDALLGAITGAVATEGSKESAGVSEAVPAAAGLDTDEKAGKKMGKHNPHKDKKKNFKTKKRPHGWDMGRKKGWDGKDVPPGLAKKSD